MERGICPTNILMASGSGSRWTLFITLQNKRQVRDGALISKTTIVLLITIVIILIITIIIIIIIIIIIMIIIITIIIIIIKIIIIIILIIIVIEIVITRMIFPGGIASLQKL